MEFRKATILVVDDEPALRDIFQKWLVAAGCSSVLTAVDGITALAVIAAHEVDILVTDVRMPGMDGIALVRRLSEMGRPIPTMIFISGFGEIDKKEMYAAGVEAFLPKPLHRDDLVTVLETALANRADLWLESMEVAPRQTMVVKVVDFNGPSRDSIHLGRGGFSAAYPASLNLGKIDFQCSFRDLEQHEMIGQGYVRWYSKADGTVGIEFFYLDPLCRPWVVQQITSAAPKSFIPNF
jgi:CheY-like chemotaxis protein